MFDADTRVDCKRPDNEVIQRVRGGSIPAGRSLRCGVATWENTPGADTAVVRQSDRPPGQSQSRRVIFTSPQKHFDPTVTNSLRRLRALDNDVKGPPTDRCSVAQQSPGTRSAAAPRLDLPTSDHRVRLILAMYRNVTFPFAGTVIADDQVRLREICPFATNLRDADVLPHLPTLGADVIRPVVDLGT